MVDSDADCTAPRTSCVSRLRSEAEAVTVWVRETVWFIPAEVVKRRSSPSV